MEKLLLDQEGYNEYLKNIDELREKIRRNSEDISEFQSDDAYGDGWHDNFAYEQAMQKENMLFHELEIKLKNLENIIIVSDNFSTEIVGLNRKVTILFEGEDEPETYFITGSSNSTIKDELLGISINSPLGKALNGKKIKEKFILEVDDEYIKGEVIAID